MTDHEGLYDALRGVSGIAYQYRMLGRIDAIHVWHLSAFSDLYCWAHGAPAGSPVESLYGVRVEENSELSIDTVAFIKDRGMVRKIRIIPPGIWGAEWRLQEVGGLQFSQPFGEPLGAFGNLSGGCPEPRPMPELGTPLVHQNTKIGLDF